MGIDYNKGDIVEITIREGFKKIETIKFNTNDKKLGNRLLGFFIRKYGFTPETKTKEAIKELDVLDLDFGL